MTCNHNISELYNDRSIASNPARGELYSIQLNVIKFVSELQQVSGYLQFPQKQIVDLKTGFLRIFSEDL
jgi:hypothetical protein